MKINGKAIAGPNREYVVIPRGIGEDVVFMVEAVLDMEPFEKMCPLPKPPQRKINGIDVPNLADTGYLAQVSNHSTKRLDWVVITSLQATEGLEWETVDAGDSRTWSNFRKEMTGAGFCSTEIDRIVVAVLGVNALDEAKIEAARDRFLREQQAQGRESFSLKDAKPITQSGEPANA